MSPNGDYILAVPKIEFVESVAGRGKCVNVPEGGALVDICDDHFAPVPFSCRSATCATCHIEVLEGLECFEPPEREERELLDVLDAPRNTRLACQAVVKGGEGKVRLRPFEG